MNKAYEAYKAETLLEQSTNLLLAGWFCRAQRIHVLWFNDGAEGLCTFPKACFNWNEANTGVSPLTKMMLLCSLLW